MPLPTAPVSASLFSGSARAIEEWPDSIARGFLELRSKPALPNGMQVQWLGTSLPAWVQPEPNDITARWHLLVVDDVDALQSMSAHELYRTTATWRIALLPDDDVDNAFPSILGGFHLILYCPRPQLADIAESLAHFLLRAGVIGVDDHDLLECIGMKEVTCVAAVVRYFPGKGNDAATAFTQTWKAQGSPSPMPWMVMGQFIQSDVSWSLQEADDAATALAEHISGPHILKCLPDAPRTGMLIITPAACLECAAS